MNQPNKDNTGKPPKHKGKRYNKGKLRLDLLNPYSTEQLAKVLTQGAEKYEVRNWEKGMSWTTVLASMKRHILAFEKGEDFDKESGLLHLAHVQANAHILNAYYKIFPEGDDRPKNPFFGKRIGLDIDEVLCDWVQGWRTKFGYDLPTSWKFSYNLQREFSQLEQSGELVSFYMNLKPRISPEDIPFEPHCYITSRNVSTELSETWIQKNGFPTAPVFTVGLGQSKVEIAKQQKLDYFVDDNFEHFNKLNEAGICCFLMDAPHNRRYNVGFKRIKSLKELV